MSGLLPVTNITGNSGILISKTGTTYNVSTSGLAYLSGANFSGDISAMSGSFSGIKTNLGSLNNPGISFHDNPSKIYKTNDGLAISANGNTLAIEVIDGITAVYDNLYAYGNLRVNQGSVNSLSINSNNDLDTGFSFPADMFGGNAGVIDAYSFGTHTFRISNGGNFSVGTTVPSGRFHVSGVSNFSGPIFASSGNFTSNLRVNNVPVSVSGHNHAINDITNLQSSLDLKANITSPAFSGVPTVPTATSGTNSNQIASTSFVRTEISNLIGSSPATLDTLNELATALGNDPNFATTVTNNLAGKANLSGATFTGNVSAPTGNFVNKLTLNNIDVSVSGHSHFSADITNFNSSVSGLLPVKDISAGTYINITNNSGIYTVNSTGEANLLETTVFNKTGSQIPKLSVVYINGGQGDQPTIALASASGEMTSSKTYGITAENINNMSTGKVIVAGALTGVNTDQFNPTAPQGDINGATLWLSPTVSGGLTSTKPSAPYHMVSVGTVVRTHQNEGVIEVRIQNGFELEELHNVAISGLANNQFIKYDSSTSLWKNVTAIASDISDFNSSVSGLISDRIQESFETVSKNLKNYAATLNYVSGTLDNIVYTLPSGIITKTFNYTGEALTSIVLSGNTPSGIDLTKTLTYTSGVLTNISYS